MLAKPQYRREVQSSRIVLTWSTSAQRLLPTCKTGVFIDKKLAGVCMWQMYDLNRVTIWWWSILLAGKQLYHQSNHISPRSKEDKGHKQQFIVSQWQEAVTPDVIPSIGRDPIGRGPGVARPWYMLKCMQEMCWKPHFDY